MEAARPPAAVQGEGAGYTAEEIAAYLQRTVGDALAEGIAATVKAQPEGREWPTSTMLYMSTLEVAPKFEVSCEDGLALKF